jgi:multidrug efflux system outer membrane protein
VEDDLARSRYLTTQLADQQDATTAAEKTSDLSLTLYRDGADDYLQVVVAQTAALQAEQLLLQVQTLRLQVAVDTVLSIGGAY